MASRLELHNILTGILGSSNVYFQPPESIKLSYPCIIYSIDGYDVKHADDRIYNIQNEYSVILIDKDPDSELPMKLLNLQYCRFDRAYSSDNLHHYSFTIYY